MPGLEELCVPGWNGGESWSIAAVPSSPVIATRPVRPTPTAMRQQQREITARAVEIALTDFERAHPEDFTLPNVAVFVIDAATLLARSVNSGWHCRPAIRAVARFADCLGEPETDTPIAEDLMRGAMLQSRLPALRTVEAPNTPVEALRYGHHRLEPEDVSGAGPGALLDAESGVVYSVYSGFPGNDCRIAQLIRESELKLHRNGS